MFVLDNSILSRLMWDIEDVYMGQEIDWDTDKPAKAALFVLCYFICNILVCLYYVS